MSMNVGKRSSSSSNSSPLGTSIETTNGGCTLRVKSPPKIVTGSSTPWKGMFSIVDDLTIGEDRGTTTIGGVEIGLKVKPFSMSLFIFLAGEDPTSMASDNLFYYLSRKSTRKLAIISFYFSCFFFFFFFFLFSFSNYR